MRPAETARRLFAAVFAVHGTPLQINSDRGSVWTGRFFKELMRILKIDQKMGTSYDHEFNGLAENVQKTIEIMSRHVLSEHSSRDFMFTESA